MQTWTCGETWNYSIKHVIKHANLGEPQTFMQTWTCGETWKYSIKHVIKHANLGLLIRTLLTCQLVHRKLPSSKHSSPCCQRSRSVGDKVKFLNQTSCWWGPGVPLLQAFHQSKLPGYGIIMPYIFKLVNARVFQDVWIIHPLVLTIKGIRLQAPEVVVIAQCNHHHP